MKPKKDPKQVTYMYSKLHELYDGREFFNSLESIGLFLEDLFSSVPDKEDALRVANYFTKSIIKSVGDNFDNHDFESNVKLGSRH